MKDIKSKVKSMVANDNLFDNIKLLFPYLQIADLNLIQELSNHRYLKKKEVFINLDERNNEICFIKKGIIRAYYIKNGEEITGLIKEENSFFASFESILLQQNSTQVFVALEDSELITLDYLKFKKIASQNENLQKAETECTQLMLAEALKAIEAFVLDTPEERYLRFIKNRAHLIQRIPQKYIASMLGITPVSLSRIRKRIATT